MARIEAMRCLARAAEFRADDTGQHVIRLGRDVAMIASRLGFNPRQVETLEQAAQLHDVGKIGVPDAVLLKPGPLDAHEYQLIQRHCQFGKEITSPLSQQEQELVQKHTQLGKAILGDPGSPIMKLAASIAETHHERWDGSGYPHGLAGEQIPIEGRITAVADVFDAISSERPYKPAFSWDQCLEIIREGRGKQFDPRVVAAFFESLDQVRRIRESLDD